MYFIILNRFTDFISHPTNMMHEADSVIKSFKNFITCHALVVICLAG